MAFGHPASNARWVITSISSCSLAPLSFARLSGEYYRRPPAHQALPGQNAGYNVERDVAGQAHKMNSVSLRTLQRVAVAIARMPAIPEAVELLQE